MITYKPFNTVFVCCFELLPKHMFYKLHTFIQSFNPHLQNQLLLPLISVFSIISILLLIFIFPKQVYLFTLTAKFAQPTAYICRSFNPKTCKCSRGCKVRLQVAPLFVCQSVRQICLISQPGMTAKNHIRVALHRTIHRRPGPNFQT